MRRRVGALVFACAAAAAEAAPPQGRPFLLELPPEVLGTDVGAAGFVVLANLFRAPRALTWLPTSGVTVLGGTAGTAISRDGKTFVGNTLDAQGNEVAAVRTAGTDWRLLGALPGGASCDRLLSSSFGASDDGRVVVGLGWLGCDAHAFRWEESTGMVDLGSTLAGRSSRANNVSGDGRVVVGWQERQDGFRRGARWVNGVQELFSGPNGDVGEAFAANGDGSLIVGTNCDLLSETPSAWTRTAGAGFTCFPVNLVALPLRFRQAQMLATSEDGRVIGGALTFGLESEALVWFDGEVMFLKDYLRQNGVPNAFEGWVNTGFVVSMTPDGRTLVGFGAGPTTFQGYMVVLPELGDR